MALVQQEQRFLTWTDWDGYRTYLRLMREHPGVRVTYDRGQLELMSPSPWHERLKELIGDCFKLYLDHLDLDYESGGSTTFKRQLLDKGLEPDQCFWIATVDQGRQARDEEEVPRPDLAVEIDVTSSSLDRIGIYAALGVPEVWRWTSEGEGRLEILVLVQPGQYDVSSASHLLPGLRTEVLAECVRLLAEGGRRKAVQAFKTWLGR